jgi:transcriptional regulator with XRE-family HTH domain
MQIRALREQRELDQKGLGSLADMRQPSISRLETPGNTPTLKTLLRIASAFDVGLLVWFVPFSELVGRDESFEPDMFAVQSYLDDEPMHSEQTESAARRGSLGKIGDVISIDKDPQYRANQEAGGAALLASQLGGMQEYGSSEGSRSALDLAFRYGPSQPARRVAGPAGR